MTRQRNVLSASDEHGEAVRYVIAWRNRHYRPAKRVLLTAEKAYIARRPHCRLTPTPGGATLLAGSNTSPTHPERTAYRNIPSRRAEPAGTLT